jgi:hypothetical protein
MAEVNSFFYDSQTRRFIIQFIRIFSGWQVQYNADTLKTVPVMYGDPSRQAATILKQNSENVMSTVPAMAAYVTGLDYDRKRIQAPDFVDKRNVRMRKRDADTGQLTTEQGNAYTIERHMPVPYILKMKLDIWTSNTTQKLQILEQILTLFNPSFEIQSTDNYFDWTSLSTVNLDSNSWDSRSVPMMNSDAISINTATFNIPIWLSPPSKVKKLGVIHRIVSSVYDLELDDSVDQDSGFDDNLIMGQRVRVTPLGFNLVLLNGELTLHRDAEFVDPANDELGATVTVGNLPKLSWDLVFTQFAGQITEGISQVSLLLPDEINEIVGTITRDETNANKLIFAIDLDTIPTNNLTAIDAVIDPKRSGPGTGLPVAEVGQRYMVIDNIGFDGDAGSAMAWRGTGGQELIADVNDLIEYDGSQWVVTFDASASTGTSNYVANLTTQIQYAWATDHWEKSFDGQYLAGTWQVIF